MATGSWLDIATQAYRLDIDDDAWLDALADALRPRLDSGLGMYGYRYFATAPTDFAPGPLRFYGCAEHVQTLARGALADTTSEIVRDVLLARTVGSASEALGRSQLKQRLSRMPVSAEGAFDALAVNAVEPGGRGVILLGPVAEMTRLTAQERRAWLRVSAHVAAGHRLRATLAASRRDPLDVAEAIFDERGRVAHAAEGATSSASLEALREAVRRLERARSGRDDAGDAGLDLWRGLVEGRWSIVDRFDTDGRRLFVAWRNDPSVSLDRGLTPRESQVACCAALGHANKHIAYELGLGSSTVAKHLAAAQAKLGVYSRVELIEVVRAIRARQAAAAGATVMMDVASESFAVVGVGADGDESLLTAAQRDIVGGVLRGLSDRQIAAERGISPRTVANQLAQVYARLGVSSRAELAARLAAPQPPLD